MRADGRQPGELRPIEIIRGFTQAAPGSVLIRVGQTHVFCTATIVEEVPPWRVASGQGWLTAEYDMLPGAGGPRKKRNRAAVDGRTQEIQRLIGRSLRMAVDLSRLGPRTLHIDCDVLQADGGTRTAAITGAYVALCDALRAGAKRGLWDQEPRGRAVAAVSVGLVAGEFLCDLNYREDVAAEVDANLVMTDRGEWIEAQATGESATFDDAQLVRLLAMGRTAIQQLFAHQSAALEAEG